MKRRKLFISILFGIVVFVFARNESFGQGTKKDPNGKTETIERERNIPQWSDTFPSVPSDKKEAKKATVFENFRQTGESKFQKPVMIYFYCKEGGKNTKECEACALFEKNLALAEEFQKISSDFGCFKCDVSSIEKDVLKRLKVKYKLIAPQILIYDAMGKKVHAIAKFPEKDKSLGKKLESILKASDNALSKYYKKLEKEAEKEAKKSSKKKKGKKKSGKR